VGRVLHRPDHPDRPVHGRLPAHPSGQAASSRPPPSASSCCWPRSSAAA
jgi:hypothetical protein